MKQDISEDYVLRYCKLKDNRGQTIVETALSIIILFLVVFGITEFGRAMYIKNCLNNAARAGVRQAVVTQNLSLSTDPTNPTTITSSNYPVVYTKIYDSLFYMNKTNVTAAAWSDHSPAVSGDTVNVKVTLTGFTSFVPRLISIGNTLIGTASMRYE